MKFIFFTDIQHLKVKLEIPQISNMGSKTALVNKICYIM